MTYFEEDPLANCEIIPGDDRIDTIILPPCTVTPQRLEIQHRVQASAATQQAWEHFNDVHPPGSAHLAGILGNGTRSNRQVVRPDGTIWVYWGHPQQDGSFRLRADIDQYDRKNLVLLGYTTGKGAIAA